ncbi:tyrosine-type recombinase/integrase [Chromobacterium vaccinii]|uniref:site-specific integrase n=1 Tax=Chromobacterium vaccinii TaxID=1108595 RepID=UPI0031D71E86
MDIIRQQPQQLISAADLADIDEAVRKYLRAQHAGNTQRAYISDCKIFATWCQVHGLQPLPACPETVVRFLSAEAEDGLSSQTLVRRRAAIRWLHEKAGHTSPTLAPIVKQAMAGIVRTVGLAPRRKKSPVIDDYLQLMLDQIDDSTLTGLRDRALLLLGFGGAFRRSELVAIEVDHLQWQGPRGVKGVAVTIPKSKTDQDGRGQVVAVLNGKRFRPVDALRAWLQAAEITSGPVFRGVTRAGTLRKAALCDHFVAHIVKRYATLAGLDPAVFGGHSLRSGFVTTGIIHDVNLFKIMDVTRHKNVQTVRGYAVIAELFKNHAGVNFM